jgi:hypothetical protein
MELGPFDDCDAAQWSSLWMHPVPGTLVYAGREPYLVESWSGSSVDVRDLSSGKEQLPAAQLAHAAPKAVAFKTRFLREAPRKRGEPIRVAADSAFEYSCAASEASTGPDAVALFKCEKAVEAKFKKAYDDVDRVREQAARMGGIAPKAEAMRNRLDADADAEEARTCAPIQKRITDAMEHAFNQVVDAYSDQPVQDPVDRLAVH